MNSLRRSGKVLAFKKPVSFQEQMKDTSRICICMPKDEHHFYEARECPSADQGPRSLGFAGPEKRT